MLEIDIYPVGILSDLLFAYRSARHGLWRQAWGRLKRIPGGMRRRSAWNGYLAEPLDSSLPFTRAGHGWTKNRARADLMRHMREVANV